MLKDTHGRQIKKLRVSLTDKCNLRCHYCMPLDQTFMDESRYLSADELGEILAELKELGVEEIRLTGGEPLMRRSFEEIVDQIGHLHFHKLALTTNGVFLHKYWDVLKRNRVHHLNISLDSLSEDNFKKITRGQNFSQVLDNIHSACDQGFVVKVNVVAMRGVNDHEILDFVKFAERSRTEVRFLEVMRIGHAREEQSKQFISAQEMIKKIKLHYQLKNVLTSQDSTSFNYVTNTGAQIGFIASESQPFCGHCSRWRLSADGIIRACLLKDDGRSLKYLNGDERKEMYQELLGLKPFLRPAEVKHSMNVIGG